jgi:hypothetical protein
MAQKVNVEAPQLMLSCAAHGHGHGHGVESKLPYVVPNARVQNQSTVTMMGIINRELVNSPTTIICDVCGVEFGACGAMRVIPKRQGW